MSKKRKRTPLSRGRHDRTVHGTGTTADGKGYYEITRYRRAGKWFQEWMEWDAAHDKSARRRRPITIAEAVRLTHRPMLGFSGGTAFDARWRRANPQGIEEH